MRDHADDVPGFHLDYSGDLVVVGGGLAGLCFAVAAAREGCPTVLVHNRPVLGGNSSSETRVVPAGASHQSAWARETGLIEEILLADRATNPAQFWENGLTNSHYDLGLYDLAKREPLLTVVHNTHVDHAEVHECRIQAVSGLQVSTGRRIRVRGQHFADCTGDAALSRLAGADRDYGREARAEYDEPLAPVRRDRVTAGSTLSIKARDVGYPVPFTAPEWAARYRTPQDIGPFRVLRNTDRAEFGGFWWFEIGYPYHQIAGTEEVRDTLYSHILGIWDYLKNHHPHREQFSGYALDWVGSVVAKRESARVFGDVVLSEHHCHADQRWPDRIAGAGWYLDLHTKHGLLDTSVPGEPSIVDDNYRAWVRTPPFTIPIRSCYSRNIRNLWLGGRLISATRVANGALRVQQTLAQLGQATGIAAAYAIEQGLDPRHVADAPHITTVQQRALYNDVRIPGMRLTAPDDLTSSARVSASSEAVLDLTEPDPDDDRPLDVPRAQILPLSTPVINEISVHLRSTSASEVTVRWRLERIRTMWQRDPGQLIAEGDLAVAALHVGWAEVPVAAAILPGHLYRLVLHATAEVRWSASTRQPAGTLTQFFHNSREHDGAYWNEASLPDFAYWCQDKWTTFAIRPAPPQKPYGPDNAVNGLAYPEEWTNIWISDPAESFPQWLQLEWDTPVRPNRLSLWFDTGLNAKLGLAPGLWRSPECVRDYSVHGRDSAGVWSILAGKRGNYQRLNRIDLPGVPVTALRVEIHANNAEPLTPQRREHLDRWHRDGHRELRDTGPRGARIYQIIAEGTRT